jgi:hypothetical protein
LDVLQRDCAYRRWTGSEEGPEEIRLGYILTLGGLVDPSVESAYVFEKKNCVCASFLAETTVAKIDAKWVVTIRTVASVPVKVTRSLSFWFRHGKYRRRTVVYNFRLHSLDDNW